MNVPFQRLIVFFFPLLNILYLHSYFVSVLRIHDSGTTTRNSSRTGPREDLEKPITFFISKTTFLSAARTARGRGGKRPKYFVSFLINVET